MKQKTRWHDALVLAAVLCAAFLIVTGTQQSLSIRSCSCFLMRVVRVLVIMDTTSIAMPENRFSGRVKLKAK